MTSKSYFLPLIDVEGKAVEFKVYGIDRISTKVQGIKLDGVLHLFKNLHEKEVQRPNGEIEALTGFEYAGYHPVQQQSLGHLLLLKTYFGKCIGGLHPYLQKINSKLVQYVTVNHARKVRMEDFYSIEAMGVEPNPKFDSCKCEKCPLGGNNFPLKEQREFVLIEKELEWKGNHCVAFYPWIKDPSCLLTNYNQQKKCFGVLKGEQ